MCIIDQRAKVLKLPQSQLKNSELEALFQKSSIMEQYFFPRTVPSRPVFRPASQDKKKKSLETEKIQNYENRLEEN